MVVSIDQVRVGVKKYVENEIASKSTGLVKFLIYFIIPSIDKSVVDYVNKAKESGMFSDMFNENGHVVVDEAYNRAVFAMEKSGKLFLEKYNLTLDRTDVEKLYQYIKEA
jgi:predicted nucleotidyltransferase